MIFLRTELVLVLSFLVSLLVPVHSLSPVVNDFLQLKCGQTANTNIAAPDIAKALAATSVMCCNLCSNTSHCAAAVYYNYECHMKATTGPLEYHGTWTAVFPPPPPDLELMLQFVSTFQGCSDPTWIKSTPVCSWAGVECNATSQRVINFTWVAKKCSGRVDLTKLPSSLQYLRLYNNSFSGPLDLTMLPSGLHYLSLRFNNFSGCVDLTNLPGGMQHLGLDHNARMSGSVDLTKLPLGMRLMYLNTNNFSGSVDLTKLPETMEYLDLNTNYFTGHVDLTHLPSAMQILYMNVNMLSGQVDLTKLPNTMQALALDSNNFSGPVDLTKLPNAITYLSLLADSHICGSGLMYNGSLCMGTHIVLPNHCTVSNKMCSYDCGSTC